jgi:hypothetical protein
VRAHAAHARRQLDFPAFPPHDHLPCFLKERAATALRALAEVIHFTIANGY